MWWSGHGEGRIYFEVTGEGPPLLFLPGITESIDEFQDLRAALSSRWRVFAADLPGSGKSEPQPRRYAPSYYRDDARTFLEFVRSQGLATTHVVGFSDGGEVALVMAALAPDVVVSVAAWGAAGSLVISPGLVDAVASVVDSPAPGFEEWSQKLKSMYGEANARISMASAGAAWQSLLEAGGDISRAAAPGIRCPVILIAGENDIFAPPDAVQDLAGAIDGAESHVVPGAGHSLHEERGPWLVDTITGWLAALRP